MKCKYCEKEILDSSLFCPHCGKRVAEEADSGIKTMDSGTTEQEEQSVTDNAVMEEADTIKEDADNTVMEEADAIKKDEDNISGNPKNKGKKKIFLLAGIAVIMVIVILVIAYLVITNVVLGLKLKNDKLEMGRLFNIKEFVETNNSGADVELVESDVDTHKTGSYDVTVKIVNGILHRNKTFTIKVIDTTPPEITGPDKIKIPKGETFDADSCYSVSDENIDGNEKIEYDESFNTNSVGSSKLELTVKDKAGNTGKKTIDIEVVSLSKKEQVALDVARKYMEDKNKSAGEVLSTIWVYKASESGTRGVDYFVLLGVDETYALYDSGVIGEYGLAECQYDATLYYLLQCGILEGGTIVDITDYLY